MAKRDDPTTAGEVRRRLAEMGDPWTVDPRLNDDDPLPDYPRGGQRDEDVPEESRLPRLSPEDDLDALLRELPPNDPDLRRRWAEEGLLDLDPHELEEAPSAELDVEGHGPGEASA